MLQEPSVAEPARIVYAPILKWKEAEQRALRGLRMPVDAMRPVIELVPRPQPSEPKPKKGRGEPKPPLPMDILTGQAIGKAMDAIGRTPYKTHPFYLDAAALSGERVLGGGDAITEVYDQVARRGFSTIPVVGAPLAGAAMPRLPAGTHAVCYRFDASGGAPFNLEALCRSADGRRMHLILDFRSVTGKYVKPLAERMGTYAAAAGGAFDTVIVAAAAFPDGLHEVDADTIGRIDRVDLLAWRRYLRTALVQRVPAAAYGDYGIQHPRLPASRPNPKQTAGIRYTLDREWLILRGHGITKENGAAQFVTLAKRLTGLPDFLGARHCAGCRAVQDTADEAGRDMIIGLPGWRHYGTIHHLTTTLVQALEPRA